MIPRKSVNQAAGGFDNQFKFIHFLNSRYIQHLQEEKKSNKTELFQTKNIKLKILKL